MESKHNTRNTQDPRERGQAIVLIAFIMVALIGMLGLAVDGGGLIYLYRDARNAADAAAIAAAFERCTAGGDAESVPAEGRKMAAKNGFNNDEVQNFVAVNNPPTKGPGVTNPNFIEVEIRAFKPSYFIQLLVPDALWVTANAVSYCRKGFDPATVPGLGGLGDNCGQGSGTVSLSGAEYLIEGNVASNGEIQFTGGGQQGTIDGNVSAVDGISYPQSGNVDILGTPNPSAAPIGNPFSDLNLDLYRPGGAIWNEMPEDKRYYITGNMTVNKQNSDQPGDPYVVLEGLYVVEGAANIDINWEGEVGPMGATIVSKGTMDIKLGHKTISYFDPLLTHGNPDIPSVGIVFYSDSGSSGEDGCTGGPDNAIDFSTAHLSGLEETQPNISGVVYAPKGRIIGNYQGNFFKGAILGWSVTFSFSVTHIVVDPTLYPPVAPSVAMAQ